MFKEALRSSYSSNYLCTKQVNYYRDCGLDVMRVKAPEGCYQKIEIL